MRNAGAIPGRLGVHRGRAGAFTLVELLVVISIFVILLAIAVPSFSSLIYTSSQADSVNSVRRAVAAARTLAKGSSSGRDTAVVFAYRPESGIELLVYVEAGVIADVDENNVEVSRSVFVPATGFAPIQFPGGWLANGYTLANSIDEQSGSSSTTAGDTSGWYEDNNYDPADPNWVFPETHFFDPTLGDDGDRRQTFIVRFEGGTGALAASAGEAVLLVMPAESVAFRGQAPWNTQAYRVDQADRHDRFVEGVKSAFASNQTQLRRLIGDEASDTVLAKGVSQVVVYNVRRLASAIGARRVNRDSRCLYSNTMTPMIDVSAFSGSTTAQDVTGLANMWFEHRLVVGGNTVDSDAIILAVDRTTGEANEVLFY